VRYTPPKKEARFSSVALSLAVYALGFSERNIDDFRNMYVEECRKHPELGPDYDIDPDFFANLLDASIEVLEKMALATMRDYRGR
jgi:hypothetical protein